MTKTKLSDLTDEDLEVAVLEYFRIVKQKIAHDERIGQQLMAEFHRRNSLKAN